MRNALASAPRRIAVSLVGLAAAGTLFAGCSSSGGGGSIFGGTGGGSGSVGAGGGGNVASASKTVESASSSPDFGGGSDTVAAPSTTDNGGGGDTGSDAQFCAVFKAQFSTIQGAESNPSAAADAFDAIAKVAPASIKADAEYVAQALHDALSGKVPDVSKVTDATANVTRYYTTNCL